MLTYLFLSEKLLFGHSLLECLECEGMPMLAWLWRFFFRLIMLSDNSLRTPEA